MQHQDIFADDSHTHSAPTAPPLVLHIEDDRDFSQAIKYRLEAHGVAVARAYDGQEGIRQSTQPNLSAVVVDFELPGGNGDEVLTAIRADSSTQDLPVIVVSGKHETGIKRRMSKLGANAYLTKPVQFSELRDTLAQHIDILEEPVLT